MENISRELESLIVSVESNLENISEKDASTNPVSGEWSKKEIIGHLIDSAANNHQRFIRAQQVMEFTFPGYQQEDWVRLQMYKSSSWKQLFELWRQYNLHLAHIIKYIPAEKLGIECGIGANEKVTLEFLIKDYLVHLRNHLRQLDVL